MKATLPKVALVLLTLTAASSAAGARGETSDDSRDERPAVVAAVAPHYPPIVLAAGLTVKRGQGKTVVDVKIDNAGAVTSAEAPNALPLLSRVCVAAAKRWRFETVDGPARVREASLTFLLDEREDKPESKADEHDLIVFKPPYTVEVRKFARIISVTNN
ncbi:MAG TPA: hypothetical protein VM914_12525 [Pyrinomonadaceae bacterium]|jgi:outer membrane biosynthesis protein TonB|nr:hypothetical protein [Pyrinomonadaceae bacterium]